MKTEQETNEENRKFTDFFFSILGWGYLDVSALMKYTDFAENIGIGIDDLEEKIEEIEGDKFDINSWFFAVIEAIFFQLCEDVKTWLEDTDNVQTRIVALTVCNECKTEITEPVEDYNLCSDCFVKTTLKKIESLKDDFSSFINCLDSWFNNCFDELDLSLSGDELIESIISLVNENVSITNS